MGCFSVTFYQKQTVSQIRHNVYCRATFNAVCEIYDFTFTTILPTVDSHYTPLKMRIRSLERWTSCLRRECGQREPGSRACALISHETLTSLSGSVKHDVHAVLH